MSFCFLHLFVFFHSVKFDSTRVRCHGLLHSPRPAVGQRGPTPGSNTHAQRNSSPHPPHPMHIIYEWEWCLSSSSCSFGMCRIDRFKMGTQMAFKAQCSTQPLKWALWQLVSLWLLVCVLDWINSGCGGKGLGLWLAYIMMCVWNSSRAKTHTYSRSNQQKCFSKSDK